MNSALQKSATIPAMLKALAFLSFSLLASGAFAQTPPIAATVTRATVAGILGFEGVATPQGLPHGWFGSKGITVDTENPHGGKQSVRIERDLSSANTFSTITTRIPSDFSGATVELRGWLRVEDVKGYAALWMRER